MNVKRIIAVGVIFSSLGLGLSHAQTLSNAQGPANFPPADFKGKQFVDNKGCAFVRAGINGAVNWVPRVTRSRKLLCGMKPTFSGNTAVASAAPKARNVTVITPKEAQPAPAARPAAKPAAKPVQLARKPAPAPKPKPQRVVRAQAPQVITPKPQPRQAIKVQRPAPQVQRIARAPQVITPQVVKPQVIKRQAAPKAAPNAVVTRRTTCPNYSGVSAQYAGRGEGVRCGPQQGAVAVTRQPVQVMRAGKPVTVQRRVATVQAQPQPRPVVVQQRPSNQPYIVRRDRKTGQFDRPLPPNTRVIPRHVYEQQQASKITRKVPKGYRKAWDDDRLNEKRAHMTVQGIRQSDLVWTRTVPRKLYVRQTGRVVNHLFPELRYPYLTMADQNRAMGLTTSTRSKPAAVAQPRRAVQQQPKASGKARYVQVGTFGEPSNAQRAAQRLQRAGLPARMGTLTRGGKQYKVVLAGPFAANQLGAALSKARRAGFSDAFVR